MEQLQRIKYPTRQFILAVHSELETGGRGFLAKQNFEFLIETVEDFPQSAGIEVNSLREQVIWAGCYYLYYLVKSHPFVDGNKRTAFLTFTTLLIKNGLISDYDEGMVATYLDAIEKKIESDKLRPREAIGAFQNRIGQTPEYILIELLFDLAGSGGQRKYESPVQIYPVVEKFVKEWNFAKTMPQSKSSFVGFVRSIYEKVAKGK